ncbi:MAG: protein kinase [Planctomycetes bacterium]|nr:protein kinase [Planctomycetota bacterium]
MGQVYAGEDLHLRRPVAIKVLSHQLLDKKDFVARFEREARAIARLNNPNIVQIYFTGTHNGMPYYAMELVPGGSLDVFKGEKSLDDARAVELLLDAARGLKAAADEGVIHRDIKPSNLVLDRTGRLKITDFGLAKTVTIDSAITHTGTIIGTPYYMSPEQGEGEALDLRADIYSLGATFYHLLAGSPPFEADSPIGVIMKHINEPLKPLKSRNKKVSGYLADVIMRMMAKDPRDRYESYSELIQDLKSLQAGLAPEGAKKKASKRSKKKSEGKTTADRKRKSFIVLDREILEGDEAVALLRCGMIRRFLALVTDFAVLCVLYHLYMQQTQSLGNGENSISVSLWNSLFLIITYLYFFLGDARGGMTLGKTLFRCRLGRRDGENLGFGKSFIRTLLFFPMLLAPAAIAKELPQDHWILTFAQATWALISASESDRMNQLGFLTARICLIWSLISFGFYLLTPGKTFLHDLMSGAYLFTFKRREPAKIERTPLLTPAPAPSGRSQTPAATGSAGSSLSQSVPPPIPKDALRAPTPFQGMPLIPSRRPKNPRLAMILSIIPGMGQVYNGDFMKGFLILLTCWLILPWALGVLDAYFKARMINRRAGFPA